ncbi:hypothetical protein J437_LFUL011238 [Ladona fulva]|uniref:Endonuclease-reverse transcriptase n=1 Tax=Ladona fulva TaxID=123851 RepID=A0A8K0P412_LADFU|nr:hypothetical protein J437_LFUL011238 [Ladona fulva]
MYERIEKEMEEGKNCCKIVMGDWNTVIGEGREENIVGKQLYTWKAPGDRYRCQIDYNMTEQRFRNGITKTCGLPGADIESDHILLMAIMNIRIKKFRMAKKKNIWNLCRIEEIGKEEFGKRIGNCMEKNKKEVEISEENWIRMKENITKKAKELIGYVKEYSRWVHEVLNTSIYENGATMKMLINNNHH